MLINFCDEYVRTDVVCSTVSTEGYEVTNLLNSSDQGFLAYSCIRPPVNIDFNFICNIKLSHVVVWPQVGAQKSSGFKLSVKTADDSNQPFTDLSTGFLLKQEAGIMFMRKDISHYSEIIKPPNFAERNIKSLVVANFVSTLRLSILKTDNSVPAVKKIQIWGFVSPKCPKDVAMNVIALLNNRNNSHNSSLSSSVPVKNHVEEEKKICEKSSKTLEIPEDFLDPITVEIMTQPIILPSGKIIDQKTLEKHGYTEATWGRPVSDPFTGLPFNDVRKPIAAFPLKERIDKFLLENSDKEEIKTLPRVLGCTAMQKKKKKIEVIGCVNKSINTVKRKISFRQEENSNIKKFKHVLPVTPLGNRTTKAMSTVIKESMSTKDIEKRNADIDMKLNSKIQIFNAPTCECCTNSILYKLPCTHIICRKALLSLEKTVCSVCKLNFKKSDAQRYHS